MTQGSKLLWQNKQEANRFIYDSTSCVILWFEMLRPHWYSVMSSHVNRHMQRHTCTNIPSAMTKTEFYKQFVKSWLKSSSSWFSQSIVREADKPVVPTVSVRVGKINLRGPEIINRIWKKKNMYFCITQLCSFSLKFAWLIKKNQSLNWLLVTTGIYSRLD